MSSPDLILHRRPVHDARSLQSDRERGGDQGRPLHRRRSATQEVMALAGPATKVIDLQGPPRPARADRQPPAHHPRRAELQPGAALGRRALASPMRWRC